VHSYRASFNISFEIALRLIKGLQWLPWNYHQATNPT